MGSRCAVDYVWFVSTRTPKSLELAALRLSATSRQLVDSGLWIKLTVLLPRSRRYMDDMRKFNEMHQAWNEWVDKDHAPIRIVVPVGPLRHHHCVEVVAEALARPLDD